MDLFGIPSLIHHNILILLHQVTTKFLSLQNSFHGKTFKHFDKVEMHLDSFFLQNHSNVMLMEYLNCLIDGQMSLKVIISTISRRSEILEEGDQTIASILVLD